MINLIIYLYIFKAAEIIASFVIFGLFLNNFFAIGLFGFKSYVHHRCIRSFLKDLQQWWRLGHLEL